MPEREPASGRRFERGGGRSDSGDLREGEVKAKHPGAGVRIPGICPRPHRAPVPLSAMTTEPEVPLRPQSVATDNRARNRRQTAPHSPGDMTKNRPLCCRRTLRMDAPHRLTRAIMVAPRRLPDAFQDSGTPSRDLGRSSRSIGAGDSVIPAGTRAQASAVPTGCDHSNQPEQRTSRRSVSSPQPAGSFVSACGLMTGRLRRRWSHLPRAGLQQKGGRCVNLSD